MDKFDVNSVGMSEYPKGSVCMYFMFLANGFEETEALVTLDLLRRAGIEVLTVGIGSEVIEGTHKILVFADKREDEVCLEDCEGIILPGGMPGTENLYASEAVSAAVDFCAKNDKLICAICAAPIILGRKGLLKGEGAVCFPGFEEELAGAAVENAPCVRSGKFITAKGAGCVFEFSWEIISAVKGKEIADSVISVIQHKGF